MVISATRASPDNVLSVYRNYNVNNAFEAWQARGTYIMAHCRQRYSGCGQRDKAATSFLTRQSIIYQEKHE